MRKVLISIESADALEFTADVLALKYAQAPFGVDEAVYRALVKRIGDFRRPDVAEFALVESKGAIGSKRVLFVGVQPLQDFGYQEIRDFAHSVFSSLATKVPETEQVALTIHGANYGLDELEAFKSEIAGILDALRSGEFPSALARISFVERDAGRVLRLRKTLLGLLPRQQVELDRHGTLTHLAHSAEEAVRSAGAAAESKPRVFVAMPFAKEMDDLFHYGIQGAVNAAGLLCERADLSAFTGDVMDWVKSRIETSKLVIADLTGSNPNVYLEVGYAWGCRVPTVLLVHKTEELKFDVRGQRAITYSSIRNLEESLARELEALRPTLDRNELPPDDVAGRAGGATIYYDRVPTKELRSSKPSGAVRAVARAPKTWPNGSTLRVRFLGGASRQRTAVLRLAAQWTQYANLRIERTDSRQAEIRVSFDKRMGNWSYVGTDALDVPADAPTMNLASVDAASVLHQFGRALGLNPIHQNPAGGIKWNEEVVFRAFAGPPNHWDADTTRQHFLRKYAVDQINGTAFDPYSIMLLPIPSEWTLNGVGTKPNEALSALDKALIQRLYPRS